MYRIWLSVFGTGFSPLISGTCGSAVVALIFTVAALCGLKTGPLLILLIVIAAHGFWVTLKYGHRFIDEFGPDPKQLVSDEQCGQAITYCWLWSFAGGTQEILSVGVTGFVLFRIFDIIKPPPVRQLESIKGAWGVLLDDVMAGVYAAIVLQLIWSQYSL
jgi:phosphatidylglycerophosphatase A